MLHFDYIKNAIILKPLFPTFYKDLDTNQSYLFDKMSLDKMFPIISSRLRKRQNDKFMEANPNLFLPIKQLSRRVQLQKNFDNFNHSCNYLKNVIRIGTRSQIPSVIIALMEHVSNLLKLCSTWSNIVKDSEKHIAQYRRDVLVNLTELVKMLDFFEETGENNSQATHILYKVFMSIEKLKNTLFDSLPQEEDNDVDSCFSPASTPGSPPHSPRSATPKKPQISKSRSIPSSAGNQITELEHSPIIRKRLNTPTHTKSMVLTQTRNHISQQKLSNSYSSVNIRNSSSNPNIANGGTPHKTSLPEPRQQQKLIHDNNILPQHRSEFFPPSSHLTHLSLGSELDFTEASSPLQHMNGPNQLQYMKRFQAMTYDPFENRTLTFTYDTDLDAPPLPVKHTRNIIPQLVYHQESVRRSVWEDNCIGKVRDRANTSDFIIDQKESVDSSLDIDINLSPKGSATPTIQRRITPPLEASDGFLTVPANRLTISSGTSSPSPTASPSPSPVPPNDPVDEANLLNRTFSALSITQEEYEDARQQVAAQLRHCNTESGVPAIPPKRRQVISYLALLKQSLSYEFPADQYEPLYVPHTSPAVLPPPPKPAKKRHSRNLERSNGSESDILQAFPAVNHKSYSSLGSELEFKQSLIESVDDENPLFMNDVTQFLQFLMEDGGQSLRGGPPDALIAYATTVSSTKIGNIFCEAFIHTYSTFITFEELLDKLNQRYFHMKQRGNTINCKNIIILLTRIIRELKISISEDHKLLIQEMTYSLIIEELILGISLKKELEAYYSRIKHANTFGNDTPISPKDFSLPLDHITNFKASILAEQMTLMDNNLFKKVTNQELLAWASDQTEGHHLSKFTAHFNKVSYWCQTRILEQENENLRKEIMRKILKIMKYLRRMNNFNSYIAIVSALESASVSRLEWSEQVTKDMEEPRALMDPSKSYQNFRKAYAEVSAPCLSYLGLYLNDLTFINVGTKSYLDEGKVNLNFSKQWTLYQTLKQLDKCRHKDYDYKTDRAVVDFFNDFNDHRSDDELYKLSLHIRPRAS